MASLLLFNKPFGVLSQFTDAEGRAQFTDAEGRETLAKYIQRPGVYPAGRLDRDSEGLLLLTDDGKVQHQIAHPLHKLPKVYWVQVEGAPDTAALKALRNGVTLNDGHTRPTKARVIAPPALWARNPPVRERKSVPTTWLELTITEGRNRQVRRMTAAVGHPTLRLVRARVGNWALGELQPGEYRTESLHLPKAPAKPTQPPRSPRTRR